MKGVGARAGIGGGEQEEKQEHRSRWSRSKSGRAGGEEKKQ